MMVASAPRRCIRSSAPRSSTASTASLLAIRARLHRRSSDHPINRIEEFLPGNGVHQPGGIAHPTFANIEWVIANHGSITIGDVSADVGCVAAAANPHLCYAMLARRERESLIDLMGRLDRATRDAAETSITIDEINPPGGFKPSGKR
jgi:hypothetical protein